MILSERTPLRGLIPRSWLALLTSTLVEAARRLQRWPQAARDGESKRWRGDLFDSSGSSAEDESDAELCLIKGGALLRAGRVAEAERFFRQAPRLASSRQGAAVMTLRAAAGDSAFQVLVQTADRARDAMDWRTAAEFYWQALQAYPSHFGYLIQYAHCLKEQGLFAEAECHYRSALALGAPAADVDEHLTFVANLQGFPTSFTKNGSASRANGEPLDALPTKADIELLIFLLLGRESTPLETVRLLRTHRTIRSLIISIVETDAFVAGNPNLLSRAPPEASLPSNDSG